MTAQNKETFLGRWSRLKREEEKKVPATPASPADAQDAKDAKDADTPPPLPAVETLTPQSDFSGFMHPKVLDSVRRVALKKLFADPHFNVEDLNEAYSGDWTGGEPITQAMLEKLNQARMHLLSDEDRLKLEAEEAKAEAEAEQRAKADQQACERERNEDEPGRKDS